MGISPFPVSQSSRHFQNVDASTAAESVLGRLGFLPGAAGDQPLSYWPILQSFGADSQLNSRRQSMQTASRVKACKQQQRQSTQITAVSKHANNCLCASAAAVLPQLSLADDCHRASLWHRQPSQPHCRQTIAASKHTTDCVHQQQLCHLRLLLADDCHSAALGRKHLQAVGQVAHIVLPQNEDQIFGLASDGVTGLVQGDVLDGALGGYPVYLVLLKGRSWVLRGLLHWEELACKRVDSVTVT